MNQKTVTCPLSIVWCFCWLSITVACLSSVCWSLIVSSLLSLGLEMFSSRKTGFCSHRQAAPWIQGQLTIPRVSAQGKALGSGEGSEVPLLQLTPSFTAARPHFWPQAELLILFVSVHTHMYFSQVGRLLGHLLVFLGDWPGLNKHSLQGLTLLQPEGSQSTSSAILAEVEASDLSPLITLSFF